MRSITKADLLRTLSLVDDNAEIAFIDKINDREYTSFGAVNIIPCETKLGYGEILTIELGE